MRDRRVNDRKGGHGNWRHSGSVALMTAIHIRADPRIERINVPMFIVSRPRPPFFRNRFRVTLAPGAVTIRIQRFLRAAVLERMWRCKSRDRWPAAALQFQSSRIQGVLPCRSSKLEHLCVQAQSLARTER